MISFEESHSFINIGLSLVILIFAIILIIKEVNTTNIILILISATSLFSLLCELYFIRENKKLKDTIEKRAKKETEIIITRDDRRR